MWHLHQQWMGSRMTLSLIVMLDPKMKYLIPFQAAGKAMKMTILFDPNIRSNHEMSDCFQSNSESNMDAIFFHYNIGSNHEMSHTFPSDSESCEDDILFDPNIGSSGKMSD